MKRLVLGAISGVVAASAALVPTNHAAARPITAAVAYTPSINWGVACADPGYAKRGIECGTIAVPLDFRKPDGSKITLAVSRSVHTSATSRGAILLNPGGPGGSGTILPILQNYVPGTIAKSYDWIGFDPRGVGESTPSLHCNSHYFGVNRPYYIPVTARLKNTWRKRAMGYAASCGRAGAASILPFMRTINSVHDMEYLRQALGLSKISYYGFSYGTYLGAAYATTYPNNVDKMILDGVVDPTRAWYLANTDQDRAFDKNMNVFWRWVAAHNSAYHLGTNWKKIRTGYYKMAQVLRRHPAAAGRLGPDELADAMLSAGYYVFGWDDIAHAYSALVRHRAGAALFKMYADSNMGDDNGYAVYSAVQCTDAPWPGWDKTRRDSWAIHAVAPFLTWGNTWYNLPCLSWKAPWGARLKVTGARVPSSVKILLIAETNDAATPFAGALKLRSLFPSASLIEGKNGTTHAGSLSGVPCVDNAISAYLVNGTVPARRAGVTSDKVCPRVPPPPATTTSSRVAASQSPGLPLVVREALIRAQSGMTH